MVAGQQAIPGSPLISQPVFLVDANGNPMAPSTPALVESNLQNWIRLGQVFTVTLPASATNTQTSGLSVFNASTGKNALVFAARLLNTGAAQGTLMQINKVTSNPALGSSATPVNHNFGSSTASLMTCSYATSGVSVTGTFLYGADTNNQAMLDLLPPGTCFLLPSTTNSGIAVFAAQGGAGGNIAISITYAEY